VRRREFITLLGGAATWPLAAHAQQPTTPVVGFLHTRSPSEFGHVVAAFNAGLNEAGYADGKNITIEYRWAEGQYGRLPELAADLVRRQVAVIAAVGGTTTALVAKAATATIPIVFATGADPVEAGLVASLNRPDSNLTGMGIFSNVLNAKRQELMRELLPTAALVAMLVNPTGATTQSELRDAQTTADKIGQQVRVFNASTDREIDAAFATIVEQRIAGLLVQGEPSFTDRRDQLVLLTTRHAIPTIFAWREFPAAGGLMSYGTSLTAAYRQVGVYAGRILKGAKPADLPVQQATAFELVINLRAAKGLGLTIPTAILLRADEVIE
jgi:putative ABC transport system substrate-binding protein